MSVQHTPNLRDTMKVVVRRNYIALSGCKKKWAKSHTSNLTVHTKALKTEAALFITDRNYKQPRCLSTKEWVKKMQNIYTLEYYSPVLKNDIMKFERKCMELQNNHPEGGNPDLERQTCHVVT